MTYLGRKSVAVSYPLPPSSFAKASADAVGVLPRPRGRGRKFYFSPVRRSSCEGGWGSTPEGGGGGSAGTAFEK